MTFTQEVVEPTFEYIFVWLLLYLLYLKPPSTSYPLPIALRVAGENKARWVKCEVTDPRHSCSPYAHISSEYTNLISIEPTHSGALWIADIIDLFLARFLQNKVYDCRKVKPSHLIITIRGKDKVIWKVIVRKNKNSPRVYKQTLELSVPRTCYCVPHNTQFGLVSNPWYPGASEITGCQQTTLFYRCYRAIIIFNEYLLSTRPASLEEVSCCSVSRTADSHADSLIWKVLKMLRGPFSDEID